MQKRNILFISISIVCVALLSGLYILNNIQPNRIQKLSLPFSHSSVSHPTTVPLQPLTLEQFFDGVDSAKYPKENLRVLLVTGDIIPARSVNTRTIKYNNFLWAFEPTASVLRDADVTYSNLESPLTSDCVPTDTGMSFCGDSRHIQGLTFAGIDVVNLANNHLGNQGQQGINQTVSYLQKAGIVYSGIENNPQYLEVRGITFAFLGYDDIEAQPGVSRADTDTIVKEIQIARSHADIVIVQFHWGVEYVDQPTERQKYLGKLAIDSGADLVIGNHPHWIQPVQLYNNKLITYAHGNFIFDQMWSEKTREGVIGKYYFYNNTLVDAEYLPIRIEDYGQAQIIQDEDYKKSILDEMYNQSVILQKND